MCGVYEVLYSVSDEAGNETQVLREVEVVENPTDFRLHYHYDMLDNTEVNGGLRNRLISSETKRSR